MRARFLCALAFLLAASLNLSAQSVQGTTSGSVCHNSGEAGCKGPFNGMTYVGTDGSTFNISANDGGSSPRELSTVPIQPAGSNLQVFVHLQPWFYPDQGATNYPVPCTASNCTSNNYVEYDGHVEVGYTSFDPGTVQRQLSDMLNRGFNGVVIDWYGAYADSTENSPGGPGNTEDKTVQAIRSAFSANPFCNGSGTCLHYAIVEDQGAWMRTNPTLQYQSCDPKNSTNQTACIEQHLQADEGYVNAQYFNNAGYLTVGNQRLIQFFVDDAPCCSGWSGADWNKIWLDQYNSAKNNYNAAQVFMGPDGFTHYGYTDGSFVWTHFGCCDSNGNSLPDPNMSTNTAYLQNFYNTAASYQSEQIWGAGYKGFDERTDQSRGTAATRYINQKCGQVWLKTINAIKNPATISAASISVPYAVVSTWNDYGEGTEIESGIDNCVGNVQLSNNTCGGQTCVTWHTNFTDTTNGTEQTIASYRVDVMHADGTWTRGIKTVFPDASGNYTDDQTQPNAKFYVIDPQYLSAGQSFFVTAVGLNSVTNHVSNSDALPPSTSTGSISVSGSENYYTYCPPMGGCSTIPNSGNVIATVNGASFSAGYGGNVTTDQIASNLASAINSGSSVVNASVSGSTVTLTSKTTGAATNYSLSTSCTYYATFFNSCSFWATASGNTMTGGR